ncbi:MAG TPA: hypothetical protein VMX16_10550 [Terriglobia bacterium]|nr:hypothetical protein [Terriglobia bacterium]
MKATKIRTVEMVRRIRDRQARSLARKSNAEVVAFFRDAGEAAMKDVRERSKALRQKAG